MLWQNELLHRQQLRTAAEVDRLAGLVRQLTAKLRSRTREAEALSAKVAVYEDDVQHAVNTAMVAIRGHVERELTAEFEAAYQVSAPQMERLLYVAPGGEAVPCSKTALDHFIVYYT